ncbi:MAG: hypothetical protein SO016_07985 [Lachnospiraceae bacterium]|nr:hypothetical protein [Robinsoniella sp.]MDY3766615.1 hypothetical protein [Lachnospiraceae bacterium]
MDANEELLNFVYQNSQMGIDTLRQMLEISEDEKMNEYLEGQKRGYIELHKKAKQFLSENGTDEKGLSMMEKMKTYWMINMQTIRDKSSSHIADMLIKGSTMGINEAVKKINDYEGKAKKEYVDLMKRLQKFEEGNIERLKEFL